MKEMDFAFFLSRRIRVRTLQNTKARFLRSSSILSISPIQSETAFFSRFGVDKYALV
jgi:hypothetical protein